ncbi:MAG TPA: hypothetical protein VHW96_04890 [Solirubrobacteraceae bacterium]|nr:hypothetical protein [Solirubrobacteraceae bacterium]
MPSLTGNTAIDVGIGLAFVYLLFSVLCSAVQEAIAGVLDLRAATLEAGLRNLLEDDGHAKAGGAPTPVGQAPAISAGKPPTQPANGEDWSSGALTDALLGHGLIRTLYKPSTWPLTRWPFKRERRGPSYIPPQTFALALLNIVAPKSADDPIGDVRTAISECKLIPAGTRSALLSLANGAATDRGQLRTEIEHWFDSGMSRVSGWYKRKTQIIICALSFVVAVGLNVNTVSIADRLVNDDGLRAALVQSATTQTVKNGESVSQVAGHIQSLGLPIGWNKPPGDPARVSLKHWGRALGGWLITFLALSLGAPFWFDALSKIAGLRATGPRPAKPAAATTGSS